MWRRGALLNVHAPIENRAALLGPSRFPWWPDWRGKTVAIIACGDSAKTAGVKELRGLLPVLAIKEAAVELCPWADVVYGCDAPWWRYRLGLPNFKGLKLRWDGNGCSDYPDVHGVSIKDKALAKILLDEPGAIGSGRNSGFQALNLAAQFGARRILLVGFDIGGEHFYGRNNWNMANNPDAWCFHNWTLAFNAAANDLKTLGVDVINGSFVTSLSCFQKMTVPQALKHWNVV